VFGFAIVTLLLVIIDQVTGGRIKQSMNDPPIYGSWNANVLFPVYMAAGISLEISLSLRHKLRHGRLGASYYPSRTHFRRPSEAKRC
jgi:hypothetical protein